MDPWIPGFFPFKLMLTYLRDAQIHVSYFLSNDRTWNLALLHQYFAPNDVDRILSIPLSIFPLAY